MQLVARLAPICGVLVALSACGARQPAQHHAASGAAPRPERAPATSALPGPCVDPLADAERRFAELVNNEEDMIGELFCIEESEERFDLDGDGVRDLAIGDSMEGGSGGYIYQVYVMDGACGHWVGALRTTDFRQASTRANGLADLELAVQAGTAHWWERRARFDGRAYLVTEERECHATYGNRAGEEPPPDCAAWGAPQLPK